jgi:hypothetical protein
VNDLLRGALLGSLGTLAVLFAVGRRMVPDLALTINLLKEAELMRTRVAALQYQLMALQNLTQGIYLIGALAIVNEIEASVKAIIRALKLPGQTT